MTPEVKICGLRRPEDARVATRAGAAYLGVVLAPSPRRQRPAEALRTLAAVSRGRVGVFVDASEDQVLNMATELRLDVVQLHGSETPGLCREVRSTGLRVWKAERVDGPGEVGDALSRYSDVVDGILLEGRSPRGLGGVGARFDWGWIEGWRDEWPEHVKLVLAGGLTAANVVEAIARTRPDVVDVSSGVESAVGVKEAGAIREFIGAVRGAG